MKLVLVGSFMDGAGADQRVGIVISLHSVSLVLVLLRLVSLYEKAFLFLLLGLPCSLLCNIVLVLVSVCLPMVSLSCSFISTSISVMSRVLFPACSFLSSPDFRVADYA